MSGLRYTLVSEGTSDRILLHVISWAVRRRRIRVEQASLADFSLVRPKPSGLAERVARAIELYPCDVLFIHRDADKEALDNRLEEIRTAAAELNGRYVPVIPVQETEAWFLHDESAIRLASGNPQGRSRLNLPRIRDVESLAGPKEVLFETLLVATEMTGRRWVRRRRERFRMRARVAELIDDFEPLLGVPAFDFFLSELDGVIRDLYPDESS